ncbi:Irregular chiasm C-roughest protein [Halotydeus destructor]|nr:Irregular chiasm C-roughest protein [Halotydeus destructor]
MELKVMLPAMGDEGVLLDCDKSNKSSVRKCSSGPPVPIASKCNHRQNQLHHFATIIFILSSCFFSQAVSAGLSQHFELSPSKNLTVASGSTVSIPCRVRNRQGQCLWIHNGAGVGQIAGKYEFRSMPDNGECSLTIYEVSLIHDDGDWQCQVTAAALNQDTLRSDTINLLVLISPERPQLARTHPYTPELQVFADRINDIECTVSNGNPAPRISWLLDGRNITEFSQTVALKNPKTMSWTVSSKLSKYAIKRTENRANLTCYSQHATGNSGDSVVLNVLYAPIVNVSSHRYQAHEGTDFSIDCKVDANPKGTVHWKRVGSKSPVSSNGRQDPAYLTFTPATRDLNGAMFECVSQNEYGASQPAIITLDVLYTPKLLNTSNAQSVLTGSSARLHCYYEGNPVPLVKWYHVNPRSSEVNMISSSDSQVLEIANATYNEEGEYFCEATNRINTIDYVVRSANMMLDIYGSPAFLSPTVMGAEGRRGGQSHVSMHFCSDPPPSKVYWQFGSIRLDAKTNTPVDAVNVRNSTLHSRYIVKPIIPLHTKKNLESQSTCYDSTLLIKDTDISDQRDYMIVIENERGTQEGIVKLRVVNPLSATLLIATALSIIIVVFVISVVTLMFLKKKKKGDIGIHSDEAKEDAQALSQNLKSNESDSPKEIEKNGRGNENQELVYANLEFNGKDGQGKVTQQALPRSGFPVKPAVVQRTNVTNVQRGPGLTTEYAQIAFTKADL